MTNEIEQVIIAQESAKGAASATKRINGERYDRNPHKPSQSIYWAWQGGFNRVWDKRPAHMITC